jgi:hypothetical protein
MASFNGCNFWNFDGSFAFPHLLRDDKSRSGGGFKLGKPSKYISLLGLLFSLQRFAKEECTTGMAFILKKL